MKILNLIWYLSKLLFSHGNVRIGVMDIDENGYEYISTDAGLALVRIINEERKEELVVTLLNLENFYFPDEPGNTRKTNLKVVQ